MSYLSLLTLLVCREKGVKRGSLCNNKTILNLFLLQQKAPGVWGGGDLWCLALTRMSHRLLHWQYDTREGEGNAALYRCKERKMFRLLKMIRRTFRKAGLNVTSNGIRSTLFFTDASMALLQGIIRTLSISSLIKQCFISSFY